MSEELLKILGGAGASTMLFVIFYFFLKAVTAQQSEIIKQTFTILAQLIEQGNLQIGYLQKIDTNVRNNIWCPYVREISGLKEKEVVSND